MKRVINIRTIVTVAALFATVGLFAQGTAIPGWSNGAGGDNYDTTGVTYMIEGATIPLYAMPDDYFHPLYDPSDGTGITTGFTWTWTEATTTLTFSQNNANDNYVAVTAPASSTGTYTVNVIENSPHGTCNSGGRNITIDVRTAPSVTFAAGSVSTTACQGSTFPSIVADINGGYQNYRLAWSLEIMTLDNATDTSWYDLGGNGFSTQTYAINNTQATPEARGTDADYDITVTGGHVVLNNVTTIYTYSLNGINDQASRWSDFLALAGGSGVNGVAAADFTYYDTTPETVVITVHPTPTTGPIFHIDASWAN